MVKIPKNIEEEARKYLNDMLSPVDLRHIISFDKLKGKILIGGQLADQQVLMNLKQEAEALEQFEIWKLLQETPKELAQRAMFVSGETLDDMKKGKTMLYLLDTQKKILETLKSYIPK